MWVLKNGICIAAIPKSGSTSIRSALNDFDWITNEEALKYPLRVAFIRNPFERFVSNYWFFNYLKNAGVNYSGRFPDIESWEDWVDFALANHDEHWGSQVKHLTTKDGIFTPTICHKFEEIDKWWPTYFKLLHPEEKEVYELPHKNKTVNEPVNDYYKQDDILAANIDDFTLWNKL